MQKYKDFPIITLDDDFIYEAPVIDYLAEYYENHHEKNNCVYSYEGEIIDIEQPYFRFFALTLYCTGLENSLYEIQERIIQVQSFE